MTDDLTPLMTNPDLTEEARLFRDAVREALDDVCAARDADRPVDVDGDGYDRGES